MHRYGSHLQVSKLRHREVKKLDLGNSMCQSRDGTHFLCAPFTVTAFVTHSHSPTPFLISPWPLAFLPVSKEALLCCCLLAA